MIQILVDGTDVSELCKCHTHRDLSIFTRIGILMMLVAKRDNIKISSKNGIEDFCLAGVEDVLINKDSHLVYYVEQ